ncbi:MAG TPA: MarR family winged helix-turn-helix transcriptional regulator [Puia sp.]|nr:MarR family winged helix-turn-helix transcriptional regulator [Puia sp.]
MSIIPLISSWEQYILTHPSGDLREFGRWLQQDYPPPAETDPMPVARHSLATSANLNASAASTLLINRLNAINHHLSKPIIRKLGLKDVEFGVLVQVHLLDKPNKKELCDRLLIEKSTGVEITRRLAKKGYLRETVDPNDRRSARLSLTEKGLRLLKDGSSSFKSIHENFLVPLATDQQQQLVAMLTRLHEYHSGRVSASDRE